MKVHTTAGHLRAATRLFRGIVNRCATVPVLGMVRLADGMVTGTDLGNELSVRLPTIGRMDGEAVIDFHGLSTLAGSIDADEELSITEADRTAAVTFNGSEYSMASCAVDDFPDFGPVEGERSATGNLGLVKAMRRVRFAISSEETRYYLNGVALLSDPDGKALVVATDGHRLATMPLDFMPSGAAGSIIPKRTVEWLCSGRHEPDACVFGSQTGRVRFELPGMTLSAKLIDGVFPDIFRVIPRDPRPVFTVDRATMLRALRRMGGFRAARSPGVKLANADGVLTLTLKSGDRSACERLPVVDAPAPFEVRFNINYLIDALSAVCGDRVTFAPDGGETAAPFLVTCDDDPLRVLVMPMRV